METHTNLTKLNSDEFDELMNKFKAVVDGQCTPIKKVFGYADIEIHRHIVQLICNGDTKGCLFMTVRTEGASTTDMYKLAHAKISTNYELVLECNGIVHTLKKNHLRRVKRVEYSKVLKTFIVRFEGDTKAIEI